MPVSSVNAVKASVKPSASEPVSGPEIVTAPPLPPPLLPPASSSPSLSSAQAASTIANDAATAANRRTFERELVLMDFPLVWPALLRVQLVYPTFDRDCSHERRSAARHPRPRPHVGRDGTDGDADLRRPRRRRHHRRG